MRSRTPKFAAAAIGAACFIAPTALASTAAHAATDTPALVMNDGSGGIWSLRPTGGTHGTQNFAGTVEVAFANCFLTATATKTNIPGTGTWSWTFKASLVSGGCVQSATLTGTGIGTITGTFNGAPWVGTITKGAGTPTD